MGMPYALRSLVLAAAALTASASVAQAERPAGPDSHVADGASQRGLGGVWVIPMGRDRAIARLVAPLKVGAEVPGTAYRVDRLEVGQRSFAFVLTPVGDGAATVHVISRLTGGESDAAPELVTSIRPEDLPAAARQAAERVAATLQAGATADARSAIGVIRREREAAAASRGGVDLPAAALQWLVIGLALAGLGLSFRRRRGGGAGPAEAALDLGPYALLVAGLGLRFALLPLAHFSSDEAGFYEVGQGIALHGRWPVLGPTVTGSEAHHPGALFFYALGLPSLLSRDPQFSASLVATLATVTLALLVRLVRSERGRDAAWIFAALAATAPWYVAGSLRIWNAHVIPWLAGLVIYGLWRMRERPRSRWLAPVVVILVVLPQFHLSAPVLWVMALAALVAWRPKLNLRAGAVGLALGAAAYLPYLLWELDHGFANTQALLGQAGGKPGAAGSPMDAWLYLAVFGSSACGYLMHLGDWRAHDQASQWLSSGGWADNLDLYGGLGVALVALSLGLALAGWARGLLPLFRGAERRRAWVRDPLWFPLGVGATVVFLLFVVTGREVSPHYLGLLLPLALVPTADLVAAAARWYRGAAAAVTLLVMTTSAVTTVRALHEDSVLGVGASLELAQLITREQAGDGFALRYSFGLDHRDAVGTLAHYAVGRAWNEQADATTVYTLHDDASPAPDLGPLDRRWHVGRWWVVATEAR